MEKKIELQQKQNLCCFVRCLYPGNIVHSMKWPCWGDCQQSRSLKGNDTWPGLKRHKGQEKETNKEPRNQNPKFSICILHRSCNLAKAFCFPSGCSISRVLLGGFAHRDHFPDEEPWSKRLKSLCTSCKTGGLERQLSGWSVHYIIKRTTRVQISYTPIKAGQKWRAISSCQSRAREPETGRSPYPRKT